MPPVRRAFSLVEMMIAVVILGLGLVMVATLFPVAIEQNRVAVQQSTVPAVARHALQTMRTKLQTVQGTTTAEHVDSSDFPGDRPHSSVDEENTGLLSVDQPVRSSTYHENPAELPAADQRKATEELQSQPRAFRQVRGANMRRPPEEDDQNNVYYYGDDRPDGILFDLDTEAMLTPLVYSQFRFGVDPPRTQPPPPYVRWPIFGDTGQRSTTHNNTAQNGADGTFPKIDIVDRVYPPVIPSYPKFPMDNNPGNDFPRWRDLREAADRRYFWTAFCAPAFGQVGPGGREIDVRIAVTFREDPAARYASQDGAAPNRHVEPRVRDDEDDTIFPQPWLVRFTDDNANTFIHANYSDVPIPCGAAAKLLAGEVLCHEMVGRLLPEGAVFIDFERGKAHRVLRNTPNSDNDEFRRLFVTPETDILLPSTLQTLYDNNQFPHSAMEFNYPDFPDYAWVFPPAVQRGDGGGSYPDGANFVGKCPVLDVIEGTIPRQ